MAKKAKKAVKTKKPAKAAVKSKRAARRSAGKAKVKAAGARRPKKVRKAAKRTAGGKARKIAKPKKTAKRKKTAKAAKSSARRRRPSRHPGGTEARWRRTDPDTSRLAAEKISTSDLERIVLDDLAVAGRSGRTTDEATDSIGRGKVSVSPRFAPLRRKGFVFGSKERRKGHSGSPMTVWKLVKYLRFEPKEARA